MNRSEMLSRGATVVEYAILVSVLAGGALLSISSLNGAIAAETQETAEQIGGVPGAPPTASTVTVVAGPATTVPPNAAPVVFAGADATIEVGDVHTQSGTVTDSGTPTNLLTVDWVAESASGTANETVTGNITSIDAWWTSPGTWTLTLTASDGFLTASDSAVVTVTGGEQITVNYVNAFGGWENEAQSRWYARARIDIETQTGAPAPGVTVYGNWNVPGNTGTVSCTTNNRGRCTFSVNNISSSVSSAKFTVTNVIGNPPGSQTWDGVSKSDTVYRNSL